MCFGLVGASYNWLFSQSGRDMFVDGTSGQ